MNDTSKKETYEHNKKGEKMAREALMNITKRKLMNITKRAFSPFLYLCDWPTLP